MLNLLDCKEYRHLDSIRITIEDNGSLFAPQDYDPWGKITRSWNPSTPYEKFKFTGKELDSETEYHYFGARYYDSFKAQWTSPDPLEDKYPGWSSYNYCLGNPVNFWDPDGREIWLSEYDENGKQLYKYQYKNKKLYDEKGNEYKPKNSFLLTTLKVLNNLIEMNDKTIKDKLNDLITNEFKNEISMNPNGTNVCACFSKDYQDLADKGTAIPTRIWFDHTSTPNFDPERDDGGYSFETSLAHELLHTFDFNHGNMKGWLTKDKELSSADRSYEVRAVNFANIVRGIQKLDPRTKYNGKKMDPNNTHIRR